MYIRKPLPFATLLILVVLTLISALCLVPAASGQSTNTIVLTGPGGQTIHPGDTVAAAYQASIADPNSIADTIAVTSSTLSVSVACPNGKSQVFSLTGPTASIDIPANSSAWYPSTPVTRQGNAPSTLCGGNAGVTNGLTLTTTDGMTCHANSAQGCCHSVCMKSPNPNSNACKPFKSCVSGQNGGCCKT